MQIYENKIISNNKHVYDKLYNLFQFTTSINLRKYKLLHSQTCVWKLFILFKFTMKANLLNNIIYNNKHVHDKLCNFF